MQLCNTLNTVRFPRGHKYVGYGFDATANRVVSYKRESRGVYLALRSTYRIGYSEPSHATIKHQATLVDTTAAPPRTFSEALGVVTKAKNQERAELLAKLTNIKPSFQYVLYSVKDQCSQFFFANTSISDALARLARRNEVIELQDIRILNVDTGVVSQVGEKQVVTYQLVPA